MSPIDFVWKKCCPRVFSAIFDWNISILARKENIHKSSNEFEIWPDLTWECGVCCPHSLIMGESLSMYQLRCF